MNQSDVGTCDWLIDELAAAKIVERDQSMPLLFDFTADIPYADAQAFAQHLVRSGLLTHFQAKLALDGEAGKLALGAYLLMDVIGTGSMGPVHRAIGRADRKPYTIRILPQRAWNVRQAREQVLAFEQLPPNEALVPFVDVGTSQGRHYLVWPYQEGQSLESMVQKCGPLTSAETARIGVEVGEVLKLCHQHGIVHGFIRPRNVLLTPSGQARLLQFGFGALFAENEFDDSLVDTVARADAIADMLECAAPESVADSSKWGARGDQYSLGCTLYFALTGRYPFPGGTFVDKIYNHQRHEPKPIRSINPDVAPRLQEIIERMMRKSANDRYRHVRELVRDLAPLAGCSGVRQQAPITVQTPLPPGSLKLRRLPVEPPSFDLSKSTPSRGLFGRLFGSPKSDGPLHAAIVSAGSARAGETIILHAYTIGSEQAEALKEAVRSHPALPRMLGRAATVRPILPGELFSMHLSVDGAVVDQPLQDVKLDAKTGLYRFRVTMPNKLPSKPLSGKLILSQDGKVIAQVDFAVQMTA